MSKKQRQRLIIIVLAVIVLTLTIEKIYNSKDEFQVVAEDASNYGIIEANLTMREKLKDFEYLYDALEENYPFFKVNERLYNVDWLGNKRKYKRIVRNTRSDAEFFVAIDTILDDLNHEHAKILSGEEFKWLYKSYYENARESRALRYLPRYRAMTNPYVMNRYIFDGDVDSIELYKRPILDTKVLIKDELAYMKIEEMAKSSVFQEDYERIKDFLKSVEKYEKLIIDIRGNPGSGDSYWENIVQLLTNEPLNASYYSFFKDGHRHSNDSYKVGRLTIIKDLDEEVLEQFPEEVKTDFKFYKRNFIRINPWDISSQPSEQINFEGKIYLLVDRNNLAGAEKFASFAKDTNFATLVGETTGGNKVFEAIPIIFLPKTKFAIMYSRELVINSDNTINMETKTIPHIQVDPTPNEDFNKDECIQAVISD